MLRPAPLRFQGRRIFNREDEEVEEVKSEETLIQNAGYLPPVIRVKWLWNGGK
jgi:hypothetical protein